MNRNKNTYKILSSCRTERSVEIISRAEGHIMTTDTRKLAETLSQMLTVDEQELAYFTKLAQIVEKTEKKSIVNTLSRVQHEPEKFATGCVKPYPEYKCMTHYIPRRRKGETITCSIRDEDEGSC